MSITRRQTLQLLGAALVASQAPLANASMSDPEAPLKPPRLKVGDTVGLISPAGATFYPDDDNYAAETLAALGLKMKTGEHLLDRYGYLAGTDQARADDINGMFADNEVAGILEQISGFVFGNCSKCGPGKGFASFTLEEVFDDHIKPLKIPACYGAMIGHIEKKFTVPLGINAEIDADTGSILLLEPAVT